MNRGGNNACSRSPDCATQEAWHLISLFFCFALVTLLWLSHLYSQDSATLAFGISSDYVQCRALDVVALEDLGQVLQPNEMWVE